MAQVNVYVPDELKARLVGSGIHLSAVAREAWEREIEFQQFLLPGWRRYKASHTTKKEV